ncbi:MAG TPA: transcription initiation protein [Chitinophagaceae bacterium]|nr:transcription initiation protein [Chitinophagaceae bacterium]
MSNFMFLFRGGLDPFTASPEAMQQNMEKWFAWVGQLQASGTYVAGEALMPSGKTLHKGNVITDGPYMESKEMVGGFFVVKADNLKAALEIAKGCPDLELGGSVEVRDVVVFE